jgi:hypothetical protein
MFRHIFRHWSWQHFCIFYHVFPFDPAIGSERLTFDLANHVTYISSWHVLPFLWHLFMYHVMSLTWDIMWHLIWQRPCNLQFFCHMVDVNNQLRLLVWDVFSHLAWHLSWQIFSHPVWHSDISGSLHQCTEANKVKMKARKNKIETTGGGHRGEGAAAPRNTETTSF